MSTSAIASLAGLARQGFRSFSEAASAVLDELERILPEGQIVLAQLDRDERVYRIVESRGDGVPALASGAVLDEGMMASLGPDGGSENGSGRTRPDPGFLRAFSVGSAVSAPLETGDGDGVGMLCALAPNGGVYADQHADVLAIASRLLAHEWERIIWTADMRRLASQLRDPEHSDPLTGLLNGKSFASALEREHDLARQGTVESYVVVARVAGLVDARERYGEPMANLLLKDAAEALHRTTRRNDHAGRVGDDLLAAVLVDCRGAEGAAAFCTRVETAVARALIGRPERIQVLFGTHRLDEVTRAAEALDAATPEAGPAREASAA